MRHLMQLFLGLLFGVVSLLLGKLAAFHAMILSMGVTTYEYYLGKEPAPYNAARLSAFDLELGMMAKAKQSQDPMEPADADIDILSKEFSAELWKSTSSKSLNASLRAIRSSDVVITRASASAEPSLLEAMFDEVQGLTQPHAPVIADPRREPLLFSRENSSLSKGDDAGGEFS
jgi:hypothetical protein